MGVTQHSGSKVAHPDLTRPRSVAPVRAVANEDLLLLFAPCVRVIVWDGGDGDNMFSSQLAVAVIEHVCPAAGVSSHPGTYRTRRPGRPATGLAPGRPAWHQPNVARPRRESGPRKSGPTVSTSDPSPKIRRHWRNSADHSGSRYVQVLERLAAHTTTTRPNDLRGFAGLKVQERADRSRWRV